MVSEQSLKYSIKKIQNKVEILQQLTTGLSVKELSLKNFLTWYLSAATKTFGRLINYIDIKFVLVNFS